MRNRSAVLVALLTVALAIPAPAQGQRAIELTADMLDRWFTAREKQKLEEKNVAPQLAEAEAKISKFEQCKRDFEAAGSAAGGRFGGLAARAGIRAKCGANNVDGYQKERQDILAGPESAGAGAGGFKLDEYRVLSSRLESWLGGDESGFSAGGLALLKSKRAQLASVFGVPAAVAELAGSAGGGRGRGARGPDVWNTDYAWIWISQMFAIQYLSGATMFESDYKPGEWTRWRIVTADDDSQRQENERAFIGKTSDGGEWWRMKTITSYTEDGKVTDADTVVLEALFRAEDPEGYTQKLVRMRGRLPGNAEAQEMMVPDQWSMWNMRGQFSMKPTRESIEGATVGIEDVTTPAGTFKAKHVRFGQGGGTIDWWLDETAVGGWVKFAAMDNDRKPMYTMELVGRGTGAKSELGIVIK